MCSLLFPSVHLILSQVFSQLSFADFLGCDSFLLVFFLSVKCDWIGRLQSIFRCGSLASTDVGQIVESSRDILNLLHSPFSKTILFVSERGLFHASTLLALYRLSIFSVEKILWDSG